MKKINELVTSTEKPEHKAKRTAITFGSFKRAEEKQIQEAFLNAFEMTFTGIEYENLKGSSTLSEKIEHVIVHDNFLKAFKDSKIKTNIKAKKVKQQILLLKNC